MIRRRIIIYFLTLHPDLPEVRSTERSKLWSFVCITKSSSVTEVWPSVIYLEYCGFLQYRTEPSVKKVVVVDCDFIAVLLMLAVTPSRIFYTVTDLERCVVIPQSASSSVIWKTMIFENQIPHVKLMSTYITWKPVRQPFTNIHYPLSHARFPSHHLNTSFFSTISKSL